MKNLLILFCALLLTSCATVVLLPVRKTASYFDFTQYKDFYITQSQDVNFKYTPLGLVFSRVESGDAKTPKTKEKYSEEYTQYSGGDMQYKEMTARDAIDLLYNKAKETGATGILNVKIEYIPGINGKYDGWSASGMAIKTN